MKQISYQKHLTLEDRENIEKLLKENHTFNYIGKELHKHPTTIAKEIQKHKIKKFPSRIDIAYNFCKKRRFCTVENLCSKKCHTLCSFCKLCNDLCPNYEEELCEKLQKLPYVCNGCNKTSGCRKAKYYYRSKESQIAYEQELKSSRVGINLSIEEIEQLDNLVSPLILKGHSISQIYYTHKDELPCGIRCLYNYVEQNILSVRNIDLRRKVKYKPRKKAKTNTIKKDFKIRICRTYEDFKKFISDNPDISIVEMDTVEGVKGGKLLLTLLLRQFNFMLAFILPDKTPQSVIDVFNELTDKLGLETFKNIFSCILTDNGVEFSNPDALEKTKLNETRCKIFYCDARHSEQKRKN